MGRPGRAVSRGQEKWVSVLGLMLAAVLGRAWEGRRGERRGQEGVVAWRRWLQVLDRGMQGQTDRTHTVWGGK